MYELEKNFWSSFRRASKNNGFFKFFKEAPGRLKNAILEKGKKAKEKLAFWRYFQKSPAKFPKITIFLESFQKMLLIILAILFIFFGDCCEKIKNGAATVKRHLKGITVTIFLIIFGIMKKMGSEGFKY